MSRPIIVIGGRVGHGGSVVSGTAAGAIAGGAVAPEDGGSARAAAVPSSQAIIFIE